MNLAWKVVVFILVGYGWGLVWIATGQSSMPSAPVDSAPMLKLSSPMLRSTLDRMNIDWIFPEKMPDFRLKMERPTWGLLSATELQGRLRGVEIQLPMQGFWVGYETAAEGAEPRATFSIQRRF